MEQIKQEMIETIKSMSVDNVDEVQERLNNLFSFIEISKKIWGEVPEINILDKEIAEAEPIEVPIEKNNEEESKILPLQRRMKGGLLGEEPNVIFVPEMVIRTQGFVHGDLIEAKEVSPGTYEYIKRGDSETAHETDRVELDYCILSKTDNLLVARELIIDGERKPIKLDGEIPHQFLIREEDIQNFNLEEDSLVTMAYIKTNPNYHRVTWVYHNYDESIKHATPKPPSYYKEKQSNKESWTPVERFLLRDKNIVIVGADFRVSDFTPLAEEAHFNLISLTGKEDKSRFESTIRKADVVISAGSHSSHRGSDLSKEFAKKYLIPFRAAPTSLSSIKKAIAHGIQEKEIAFHSFF